MVELLFGMHMYSYAELTGLGHNLNLDQNERGGGRFKKESEELGNKRLRDRRTESTVHYTIEQPKHTDRNATRHTTLGLQDERKH